ncbi:hypothetical protein LAZ67_1007903 [Cordylochernes scorpioides]|uniref:Uncharacterized protein n=1 Tax=Cordylochernes scorpioides TaxID=51811 RepID=A0ABY6K0G0_9ARAC|nr:hypothetical protein LAZ67_1007903 [Cordylochernes scorpioides]
MQIYLINKYEGIPGTEIHRILVQYRNSVLPQQSVYEWIENLKNGRTSVTQDKGARSSFTAKNKKNIERACDLILLDRRVTIDKRLGIFQKHLDNYGNELEIFLNRIVTGDETWIPHYERRVNGRIWIGNIQIRPARKISKANHLQKNLCLEFFFETDKT